MRNAVYGSDEFRFRSAIGKSSTVYDFFFYAYTLSHFYVSKARANDSAFVRYLCNRVSLFVMRSVNKTSPERFEVFAAATMIYVCNKYLNGKQL